MGRRKKKKKEKLIDKLLYGDAVLRQDEDFNYMFDMTPIKAKKFPALIMKFWDKDDFLEDENET